MTVRAFVEIRGGILCGLVDSSRTGRRIEVLNPICRNMILDVRERRKDGSYSRPRIFNNANLGKQCDECALESLVAELDIHIDTFVVQEGIIQVGFVASDEHYRSLLEGMGSHGIKYKVVSEYSREPLQKQREITANQRKELRLALETGFFDYPRNSNLSTLSTLLGKSPSTVAESIRRAEKRILWTELDKPDLSGMHSNGKRPGKREPAATDK